MVRSKQTNGADKKRYPRRKPGSKNHSVLLIWDIWRFCTENYTYPYTSAEQTAAWGKSKLPFCSCQKSGLASRLKLTRALTKTRTYCAMAVNLAGVHYLTTFTKRGYSFKLREVLIQIT